MVKHQKVPQYYFHDCRYVGTNDTTINNIRNCKNLLTLLAANSRFGILESQNRVMKPVYVNDVTLQVTNSKIFIESLLSSY